MLQKILNIKMKGSTLPEVLIALVLMTFCTSLAVLIYLNVQQNTMPFSKMKADELAKKYLIIPSASGSIAPDEFEESGFRIKRMVDKSTDFVGCTVIKVVVYNSLNKKLSELEITK